MERRLPIFELTPEAMAEGLRMSSMLLPLDAAAQRAKSTVARFPSDPEDLWRIKMRPEKGYISLVSLAFDYCRFCTIFFLLLAPDLGTLAGTKP
jgi:hypothetical protein